METAAVSVTWLFLNLRQWTVPKLLLTSVTVHCPLCICEHGSVYGAEVWQIPTREINIILSTEMDVLRRSARKSRMERRKNEQIKEIIGMKGKLDIRDIIQKKRLQWYGHIKRMPEEQISKLIMEWIPLKRRKRGSPVKTWIEGIQAAMTTRNLETERNGIWFPEDGNSCYNTGWMDEWVGGWVDR